MPYYLWVALCLFMAPFLIVGLVDLIKNKHVGSAAPFLRAIEGYSMSVVQIGTLLLAILGAYVIIGMGIATVLFGILPSLIGFSFKPVTFEYLRVTFTAIMATSFGNSLAIFVLRYTGITVHEQWLKRRLPGKTVTYLIYSLYLFMLVWFSILQFETSTEMGVSPLFQSFATFLAFDWLRSNRHALQKP